MFVTPYVFFNGNCAEACRYYEKVLGARTTMSMTYGQSPAASHVPAAMHDKVIHAHLVIGNTSVLMSDGMVDEDGAGKSGGYSLCITVDTPEVARKMYAALADGGTVKIAIDKTFFAEAFGQLTDRFGISWMIICEKPH